MGVEHLNNAGCRKLLIITHRIDIYSEDNVHNDFLKGCRDKAKELGIPLIELHKQVDAPDYVETIREIFMDNHDLDGVFSLGDYMLIPLYQLMPELGRKIGDDIAILGYYNTPWCGLLTPKLSSIDIKVKDIVDTACGMYFKDIEALSKNIEPEIIIRKSSCLNKKIV
jgi:DNA-binding LacI/PurR family transcriptional regulator